MPARARHTDPDTSHAAAATVGELTERQEAVITVFKMEARFLLDEELVAAYRSWQGSMGLPSQTDSGIRSRRSEIFNERSLLEQGDKRRMTTGGLGRTFGLKETTA